MMHEVDIYGVFVPDLAVWVMIAFVLNVLLKRGLAAIGFYRIVWHRALFDTALYVIVLGGVVATAERIFA